MILGTGIDITELSRMKEVLERSGDAFLTKVFTGAELAEGRRRKDCAGYFAGRWAVKEAVSKALGTGIGKGCSLQDVETLNDDLGKPVTRLSGAALASLHRMGGGAPVVTLSHDGAYALAMAIIEKGR